MTGKKILTAVSAVLLIGSALPILGDTFTEEDEKRWEEQFAAAAQEGRRLWTSPELGTNGLVCAQCHPNAANTHPETYPKFQKQLGKVAPIWEMINWCIRNPVQGKALDPADPRMTAIHAYIARERKGVPLAPGKH